MQDGTTDGPAKLVLLVVSRRPRRIEVVTRVQDIVAQELKSAAVKLVGARLGDDVDLAAGIAAVLSVKVVG